MNYRVTEKGYNMTDWLYKDPLVYLPRYEVQLLQILELAVRLFFEKIWDEDDLWFLSIIASKLSTPLHQEPEQLIQALLTRGYIEEIYVKILDEADTILREYKK